MLHDEGNHYVFLGESSTDWLENPFSKLRQGSGGVYFVNVKQETEKFRIPHAKVQISLDPETVQFKKITLHEYGPCGYVQDSTEAELLDQLPRVEVEASAEIKSNLIYIARFVIRKNTHISNDIRDYMDMCIKNSDMINRGGLCTPRDKSCQRTLICFIMTESIKQKNAEALSHVSFIRLSTSTRSVCYNLTA